MADQTSLFLTTLLLGGLMGLLGQGSRAVIGLKGVADAASAPSPSQDDVFRAARLYFSLMIGFLVGLAAAVIYLAGQPKDLLDWHTLVGFAAAGYVGTDFLEGFISNYLAPKTGATIAPQQKAPAAAISPEFLAAFHTAAAAPKKPSYQALQNIVLAEIHTSGATVTWFLGNTQWDDQGKPTEGLNYTVLQLTETRDNVNRHLAAEGYVTAAAGSITLNELTALIKDKTVGDFVNAFATALGVTIPGKS